MNWDKGIEVRRLDNPGKVGSTTGQQRERSSGLYIQIKWHQDGSDDRCKGCGNSEGETDQIVCDGKTKADF